MQIMEQNPLVANNPQLAEQLRAQLPNMMNMVRIGVGLFRYENNQFYVTDGKPRSAGGNVKSSCAGGASHGSTRDGYTSTRSTDFSRVLHFIASVFEL